MTAHSSSGPTCHCRGRFCSQCTPCQNRSLWKRSLLPSSRNPKRRSQAVLPLGLVGAPTTATKCITRDTTASLGLCLLRRRCRLRHKFRRGRHLHRCHSARTYHLKPTPAPPSAASHRLSQSAPVPLSPASHTPSQSTELASSTTAQIPSQSAQTSHQRRSRSSRSRFPRLHFQCYRFRHNQRCRPARSIRSCHRKPDCPRCR